MTQFKRPIAPLAALLLFLPLAVFAQEGMSDGPSAEWLGLLGLGFLFGLKHALDADHLVAIGAIVGENRGARGAALTGLWWGIGHTLSLLVAGFAVLVLRLEISEQLESSLEMGVALMIILLGGRVVWQLLRGKSAVRFGRHSHGMIEHAHPHLGPTDSSISPAASEPPASGLRSLVIGVVHGLAGSAALMLLVLAQISQPTVGLLYIVIFGLGSIIGMIAMSTLFWLPFLATTSRFRRVDIALRAAAGFGSVAFGIMMFFEHL